MVTIDWEWKYKIFFNQNIKKHLLFFAGSLEKEEQKIMKEIINFYSSFFTIGILLKNIKENIKKEELLISLAEKNVSLLARSEPHDKETLLKEINELDSKNKKRLINLLNKSINSKLSVNFNDYLKIVLGDNGFKKFSTFLSLLDEKKLIEKDNSLIRCFSTKESYRKFLFDIQNRLELNKLFGVGKIKNFCIKFLSGSGYGEWWDSDLYDKYKKDTLVIFKNKNVSPEDLFYTLLHEVYPGHAHFFDMTKHKNSFDTGAFLLIEGYSTYVECHSINSNYSFSYYNYYLKLAKNIILNCQFDNNLSYWFTQFPGYYESYYVGCFLIKFLIENYFNNIPHEFLCFLNNVSKGDFFKLWLKHI